MSIKSPGDTVQDEFRDFYPEGDELKKFVDRRKRMGSIWLYIFIGSTIVAIIALSALLYTIVRDSFGYVVLQNAVDPSRLVINVEEERMLTASNTISSEDDNELVEGIIDNPYAIGFFGHAYYTENSDGLKAISINGNEPSAEATANDEYPYARPLYLYSAAQIMEEKANVSGFINFYLNNVETVVEETGYFPPSEETIAAAKAAWLVANEMTPDQEFPVIDPSTLPEDEELVVAGSSTVYPVTRQMAIDFRRAGYPGGIDLDSVGTTAGFRQLCQRNGIDIANASRPIGLAELKACESVRRSPVEFNVGTDALAIVVSQNNEFLQDVSIEQLNAIFTDYETWSEVDPSFPDEPIQRFVPGADSGTLDFFASVTFARELEDLPAADLIAILEDNVSSGRLRALEADQALAERSQENLLTMVTDEVLEPRVVTSWNLVESLFNKAEIEAEAAEIPRGRLQYYNWLNADFLSATQASVPEYAGIRTAIFGSLWTILITIIVALPLGVGAAIYLEEYATMVSSPMLRRLNGIIQTNINNLAGVPSIIYGLLGLAVFVRALEAFTSGTLFGLSDSATANGRTIISAGLTLALLILPLIIINAQEAIRAVPQSLRQAGMGLGATKWQTIWHHVLPNAIPGILTGNILAVSRAIGETAPLVVVGASTFITVDPSGRSPSLRPCRCRSTSGPPARSRSSSTLPPPPLSCCWFCCSA